MFCAATETGFNSGGDLCGLHLVSRKRPTKTHGAQQRSYARRHIIFDDSSHPYPQEFHLTHIF